MMINRHVTQSTCGSKDMRWCERAWTALVTCKKHGRDMF